MRDKNRLRLLLVFITFLFLLDYFDKHIMFLLRLPAEGLLEEVFDQTIFFATALTIALAFMSEYKVVKKLRENERFYRSLAYQDALTGLPNRRMFEECLRQAISGNGSGKIAVLFIDLDGFKHVNDTFGHEIGDLLLQEVTRRLKTCVRDKDMLSRLGGDEFTVLLPVVTHTDAAKVAERIIEVMRPPFKIKNSSVHVTPSIGIALYPEDGKTPNTLINCADVAMYQAKRKGKNTYQFFKSKDAFEE